ncbi:MAG TPA: sugar phosphate nucleotidyltransferase [Methylomirabilota bacterium]
MTDRAVVLARGLGTRMRRDDRAARLTGEQASVAGTGVKALIPIGRPFLDYGLSALADAGVTAVCLVIGPEHGAVREYYMRLPASRLRIDFAEQVEPRGTADAVLAAEAWVGGEPFLRVNSDNYYPVAALEALAALDGPGLVAFTRQGLVRDGRISPERIARFAVLDVADGRLRRIVEKPDEADVRRLGDDILVSMNAWRLDGRIFDACRRVPLSPRGELELPSAVQRLVEEGVTFHAVRFEGGVLDLSSRGDIAPVAAALAGVQVRL